MRQYLDIVDRVLTKGTHKTNRTGVDTISTFGEFYKVDLEEGYPLLTTKKSLLQVYAARGFLVSLRRRSHP